VLIRGANHNDFDLLAGGQILNEVTRFVGDVLKLSGNSDKPAAGRRRNPTIGLGSSGDALRER
jgi:hypothetical protein